ncbi:MAG: S-methyl-5-thioribose-1-phosphate isomerase, partial [Nitrososphaerales archaeon]
MEKQKISFFDQRTIEWDDDTNAVRLIDQTLLPTELVFMECRKVKELVTSIKTMRIRGAPALGVAGAMGVALAVKAATNSGNLDLLEAIAGDAESLKEARPTAVNLSWGVERALAFLKDHSRGGENENTFRKLVGFVKALADEDVETNKKLSEIGQVL